MYADTIPNLEKWKPEAAEDVPVPIRARQLRTALLSDKMLESRDKENTYAEEHGKNVLEQALEDFANSIAGILASLNKTDLEKLQAQTATAEEAPSARQIKVFEVLKHFIRLDGYNLWRRSTEVFAHQAKLTEPKHWEIDVRTWRENELWVQPKPAPTKPPKGKQPTEPEPTFEPLKGSHDALGNIRPEYKNAALDSRTQYLDPDFLESECIEANDFNLSASRYKPLQLTTDQIDPEATKKLLQSLLDMEKELHQELQTLLDMVEGKA
jgi:hypothetical protein